MIDTHGMTCDFGEHAGTPWTRLPAHYVLWVANVKPRHDYADIAEAELARRGTRKPTIEVSGHAIDRASQHYLNAWQNDSDHGRKEGIHSWLVRVAEEALQRGVRDGDKVYYRHMAFVFQEGMSWPTLKTVIRKKGLF